MTSHPALENLAASDVVQSLLMKQVSEVLHSYHHHHHHQQVGEVVVEAGVVGVEVVEVGGSLALKLVETEEERVDEMEMMGVILEVMASLAKVVTVEEQVVEVEEEQMDNSYVSQELH